MLGGFTASILYDCLAIIAGTFTYRTFTIMVIIAAIMGAILKLDSAITMTFFTINGRFDFHYLIFELCMGDCLPKGWQ